jgi:hypothetical protein
MTATLTLPKNNQTIRFCRIVFTFAPYLILAGFLLFEFTAIRALCAGKFVYSLDDPYIHLALSERIAGGTYGINPGEPAAPSSSMLWPFLLAPFAAFSFFEYIPLIFNLLLTFAALFVYAQIARLAFTQLPLPFAEAGAAWLAVFLIPATNLVGLAFTGMEHSLQVFLCALIVLGLVSTLRSGSAPRWLAPVLVFAPWVRYECLAIVVPAVIILYLCRQRNTALISLFLTLAGLAAFSILLHSAGLGWVPASILAKFRFSEPLAGGGALPQLIIEHIRHNLFLPQGITLAVVGGGMLWRTLAQRANRLLGAFGAVAILFHLAGGQFGWWDRYEVYIVTTTLLLLVVINGDWLAAMVSRVPPRLVIGILLVLSLPTGILYTINFLHTPVASANIYEQQYQMHRFVLEYLHAPVAVNDLGWVAFRNPNYVLDLWGLASSEALADRTGNTWDTQWMERLTRQHHVQLVMVYDTWFHRLPQDWILLARLHLGWPKASAGGDTVSFYALDPSLAPELLRKLQEFQTTLPQGVRLELYE